jgi:hypothetical protein
MDTIKRSSTGLRDAIFDEWDALRQGKSNPKQAMAVAHLAKQIVNSVKIEIEFAAHVRTASEGQTVALTAPLQLGASDAAS